MYKNIQFFAVNPEQGVHAHLQRKINIQFIICVQCGQENPNRGSTIPVRNEARFFLNLNGASLHSRSLHFQLSIVLIWLYYWRQGRKAQNHPSHLLMHKISSHPYFYYRSHIVAHVRQALLYSRRSNYRMTSVFNVCNIGLQNND